MNAELQGLQACQLQSQQLEHLEEMYISSFPECERRPWAQILAGVAVGFEARPLFHREQICGFVTIWRLPTGLYVEHLVVDAAQRGAGIGSKVMLDILAEARDRAVILEIEPPEQGIEAMRRQAFYQRLGLQPLDYPYIQPPYEVGGSSVRLNLMSNQPLSLEQIERVVDDLYRIVYQVE